MAPEGCARGLYHAAVRKRAIAADVLLHPHAGWNRPFLVRDDYERAIADLVLKHNLWENRWPGGARWDDPRGLGHCFVRSDAPDVLYRELLAWLRSRCQEA